MSKQAIKGGVSSAYIELVEHYRDRRGLSGERLRAAVVAHARLIRPLDSSQAESVGRAIECVWPWRGKPEVLIDGRKQAR